MTVEMLREKLYRVEHDPRLLPAVRDEIRIRTIGVLNPRPRNVGEAKRLLAAYEAAIAQLSSEIPF